MFICAYPWFSPMKAMMYSDSLSLTQNYGYQVLQALVDAKWKTQAKKQNISLSLLTQSSSLPYLLHSTMSNFSQGNICHIGNLINR